jgi:hypothetical protein
MKKRTLLLGPCKGCEKGGDKHKAWTAIGKILKLANQLYGSQSSPQKDAFVASTLNAAGAANSQIGNHSGFKSARAQYDKLMNECGFGG